MKLNFLLKSCRRLLSSCRAGGCAALRCKNIYQKNMNGACSNMHRTLTSGCLRLMLQSNTGAGRNSFFGRSLHHLGQHPGADLNPYEQAIRIIGNTLAIFDEDQLIPAYAFGDGEASRTRRLLCMHGRAACRPLLHSHWFMCHCCRAFNFAALLNRIGSRWRQHAQLHKTAPHRDSLAQMSAPCNTSITLLLLHHLA